MQFKHATQATARDSGDGKISSNAWNESHEVTGTPGMVIGFDNDGNAIELDPSVIGTGITTVASYGASGVGDETLQATNYSSDLTGSPVTITQQTADGIAINQAIVALRAAGGGTLVFPKGVFTTYGYLERIDFPLKIVGAGRGITIIRNIAASPWDDGYGIFVIQPSTLAQISISDLTLDGGALIRTASPNGQIRSYPLDVHGKPQLTLNNVEIRNSIIDCMVTSFSNDPTVGAYLQATNCLFSNAWRNTVSLVGGWNQQYTNCILEKGGKVLSGSNPRTVLDIEPNTSSATIKNITFSNCILREAINQIIACSWAGNVRFDGCLIQAFGGDGSTGELGAKLPLLAGVHGCQISFNDCTMEHTDGTYEGLFDMANTLHTGDFATSQVCELIGCRINGAGIFGSNNKVIIKNTVVRDSLMPVYLGGNNTQNALIDGLELVNVFDINNVLSQCAFGFSGLEGYGDVSNVTVRIDTATMPSALTTLLSGITKAYGVTVGSGSPPTSGAVKMSNIHVSGFYRQLPTFLSKTLNTTNFRDWFNPTVAPSDTAGVTTNGATRYYRNCTEYGDAA